MERVKHLKAPTMANRSRSPSIDMIVMDEVSKIISSPPPQSLPSIVGDDTNSNSSGPISSGTIITTPGSNILSTTSNINSPVVSTVSTPTSSFFLSTPNLQQQQQFSPPLSPRGTTLSFVSVPNLSLGGSTPPSSPKPSDLHHHHHHSHSNSSSSNNNNSGHHQMPPHISISILERTGLSRNSSFNSVSGLSNTLDSNPPTPTSIGVPPPPPFQQLQQSLQPQQADDRYSINSSGNSLFQNHASILHNTPSKRISYRDSMSLNGADQPFPPPSPNRASLTLPPVQTDSEINNSNGIDKNKIGKRKGKRLLKRLRRTLHSIIESWWWMTIMVLTIFFIIFIDDIMGLAGSPSSNSIDISIITVKIAIMLYFAVDLILCIILYGRRYYPGTIVFWLDLFSLLSIVPDIVIFSLDESLAHEMMVLSIGKAARIIRICGSFVRISLIATIYNRYLRKKYYLAPINTSTSSGTPGTTTPNHNDNTLEVEASRLGDKLIRLTTNKIVLLVLLVFFATQLLTYQPPRDVYIHTTLSALEYQANQFGTTSPEFLGLYQQFLNQFGDKMTNLVIGSHILYRDQSRIDSLQRDAISTYDYSQSTISLDDSHIIRTSSAYHLALTCFVILILIITNLLIVNDAHWLVINPLENVLAIVKLLSRQNASIQHSHQQYAMHTANGMITSGHNSFRQKRLESIGSKSEDTTSSSGVDGDEVDETDEANYLLGMLNDIDGSLQAAKEKVEEETYQNAKLRNHIEDLFLEKFILNIHLSSILRKIEFEDILGTLLKKNQEKLTLNINPMADGINSDEIKYKQEDSQNPTIVCATLDKLIDRLSKVDNHDIKFANVFLLTFRRFISPIELMERLVIRFCVTPQYDLPSNVLSLNEMVDDWRRTKQEHIRVSVFNVIKLWIGKYYWDFVSNQTLVDLFNMLVHQIMPYCRMERYALHLDTLFKRKVASYVPLADYQIVKPLTSEEIAELMVVEDKFLFNFDIVDIATQITLVEFELFKSIRPQELIDLSWTKSKTKTKTSPNVVRFIDHFNNVSFWIQMQIVKCGKIKDRVNVIKRVIQLGESFVNLNNFYGAMEVLSSLESASVSRLHRTWDLVPVSSKETFQQLQKLLSPKGSFKEYRERLKQTTSACIPYLGIYLSDLTFIEEGNPDYREDNLINYTKLREIAATILSIQQFQNTLHYYQPVKEKIKSQMDLKCIMDNETIWKMSLSCEARRT